MHRKREKMPVCKNCNSRIDKFNKDRCPICGVERPFEGVSSDTVEVTSRIDSGDVKIDYHPRKRKTLLTLFALCGLFFCKFAGCKIQKTKNNIIIV